MNARTFAGYAMPSLKRYEFGFAVMSQAHIAGPRISIYALISLKQLLGYSNVLDTSKSGDENDWSCDLQQIEAL